MPNTELDSLVRIAAAEAVRNLKVEGYDASFINLRELEITVRGALLFAFGDETYSRAKDEYDHEFKAVLNEQVGIVLMRMLGSERSDFSATG